MKFNDSFMMRLVRKRLTGRFTLSRPFNAHLHVVKAYDHTTGDLVALKCGDRERLRLEWCRLRRMSGEGVLQPKTFLPDLNLLVFPWLQGGSLAARMMTFSLPVPRGLALLGRIAEAVAGCHRNGFIHGDLKPANIMVSGNGFLIDFTHALWTGQSLDEPCYLSPSFAAPDYLRREGCVRESFDWFSLAVTLELLMTRQHPFSGKTILETPGKAFSSRRHYFNWQACRRGHEMTRHEFMGVHDRCCDCLRGLNDE